MSPNYNQKKETEREILISRHRTKNPAFEQSNTMATPTGQDFSKKTHKEQVQELPALNSKGKKKRKAQQACSAEQGKPLRQETPALTRRRGGVCMTEPTAPSTQQPACESHLELLPRYQLPVAGICTQAARTSPGQDATLVWSEHFQLALTYTSPCKSPPWPISLVGPLWL